MTNRPVSATSSKGLVRSLRLFDLVMMGVGMMIGAGAVLGMGEAMRLAGPGGTLTGKVEAFLTLGQILILSIVAVAGGVVVLREPDRLGNLRPLLPHGLHGVLACMGLEFVAFEGYEAIVVACGVYPGYRHLRSSRNCVWLSILSM